MPAKTLQQWMKGLALVWVILVSRPEIANATRVEELCDVKGVRPNQVIGYGLVAGLNQTGDLGQARFTVQSTVAMLKRLGATVDPKAIQTRNAAAVMVTATIPPFANPGLQIDVVVSSLGNARSLVGGTLLQTALYGADRKVYAVAQGPLIVGGFAAVGRTGSLVGFNQVTTGRIPQGAIVERPIPMPGLNQAMTLSLRDPNFTTAKRVAEAVNAKFGEGTARASSSGSVDLKTPETYKDNLVGLLSEVQQLDVAANATAKVVVDERTGTVVLGTGVRISEVAVAQGGLTLEISERFNVSQPLAPFGRTGQTAVVPDSNVQARAEPGQLQRLPASASLADVVAALNSIGAKPRDLIGIFQALRAAGALQAHLEVQ